MNDHDKKVLEMAYDLFSSKVKGIEWIGDIKFFGTIGEGEYNIADSDLMHMRIGIVKGEFDER